VKKLALIALVLIAFGATLFAEPTVVRYSRWAGGSETEMFQALVDSFNNTVGKDKNITVKFEPLPWGAYWEKLRTTVLAGDAPDVISLSNAGENGSYLTRGVFLPLNKEAGIAEAVKELAKPALDSLTVNGKYLGLPIGLGVRAMVYNKALLKEAGLAMPDPVKPMTWEQFMKMSEKLSKKGADGKFAQYTLYCSMDEMVDSVCNQYGVQMTDSKSKPTKVTVNTKEGIAALTFIQDLYKKNVCPPNTGEWQTAWGTPDNAIATGKVAFMLSGPWGLPTVKQANVDFGTCPVPVFAGKEKFRATRGYINGIAVYKGSKAKDGALEFVKWLTSKAGQLEFTKTGDLPANTAALAEAQKNADKVYTNGTPEQYKAYFADLPYVTTAWNLPTSEWTSLFSNTMLDMYKLTATPAATAAKLEKEGNLLFAEMWD
jgi:multiple sugar transport system substrate-binding protein